MKFLSITENNDLKIFDCGIGSALRSRERDLYTREVMKTVHNVKKVRVLTLLTIALSIYLYGLPLVTAASDVNVWWPTNGAHVTGTQPFKAMVPGTDVSQYDMFWQVDGGQWVPMDNNYTDYQHKEASVNVSGWNWRGSGPYTINFIERKNGAVIAQQSEQIYIDQPATVAPASFPTVTAVQPTQTFTLQSPVQFSTNGFYVNPNTSVAKSGIQALASQPVATWFGDWNSNIQNDAHSLVANAGGKNAVMVAYDIPGRDCGGYSSGGTSQSNYINWIRSLASGIGSSPATVILEPDALANITCLSSGDQSTRYSLLSQAVQILKQNGNTKVYLDAGHSGWNDPSVMAGRLAAANIAQADGFSLNVSNFDGTASEASYGSQISAALQQKIGKTSHFIIDTSRNGNGSNGDWCNPSGRAIGQAPTTSTGNALVDAYLWVKTPGESDGYCNGGPSAGTWWQQYAQGLAQNAH